jgi:hypothetical protein
MGGFSHCEIVLGIGPLHGMAVPRAEAAGLFYHIRQSPTIFLWPRHSKSVRTGLVYLSHGGSETCLSGGREPDALLDQIENL